MSVDAAGGVRQARRAAWVGMGAFLVTSMFWGANLPLTTVLLRSFDPFWLTPWRLVLAAAALGAVVCVTEGYRALRVEISWARFLLLGLSISLFFIDYVVALRHTNTVTAAAVMAGGPIYAVVTLRLITGTPVERGFGVALLLTLIGSAVTIYGQASALGRGFVLMGGEPLVALSIVLWTIYSILAQRWFVPATSQLRRAYTASLGAVIWLFLFWLVSRLTGLAGPPNLAPSAEAVLWMVFTAVFATGLGNFTWNIGVSRAGLAMGSLWQNAVPVFGVIIATLFGIYPLVEQVVGGLLVMAGVLYMQWRKLRA
ncbi:MAG: DMT family transporter [Alphaproteobacteria bacterium]|nr:DMT family transporter [Alphaproteobacteria bacterium]